MSRRMPVFFVGHGSPMNAIETNVWSRGFRALGEAAPAPKAILAVSAHWYVPGTFLTDNALPETIHDFGGFPKALFDMQYPARGSHDLAERVVRLVGEKSSLSTEWGLDHGTWSVLHHMRPEADVPVVQLSIDRRLTPAEHLALGRTLAPLRDEGIWILASGNVTHNLREAMTSRARGETATPGWASRFDTAVEKATSQHDGDTLAKIIATDDGRMSHPSLDHYLPLLYAVGAAGREGAVKYPIDGFDYGSLSMRSVVIGG
jgi:4,5-DOPA dioxygenase extradiol